MKNIALLLAYCTATSVLFAQDPGFEKTYYTDACKGISITKTAMAKTSDGGYLVSAGNQPWLLEFDYDAVVFRLDAQGDTIWSKNYGSLHYPDAVRHILPLSDGNFLLSGSRVDSAGIMFVRLLKINPLGDLLWEKEINPGWSFGWPTAAFELSDGSFVLAGNSLDQTIFLSAFLLRLSPSGDIVFVKYYPDFSDSYDVSVVRNELGEYFFGGVKKDANFNDRFGLSKVDQHGNLIWSRTYYTFPDIGIAVNPSLNPAPGGGFYLTGADFDADQAIFVGVIFRLQPNGSQMWRKYLYGANNWDEIFTTSTATDDGGLLVLAESQHLVKYLPSGDTSYTLDLHPYLADSAFIYNMFRANDGSPLLVGDIHPDRLYLRKLSQPLFTPTIEPVNDIGQLAVYPSPSSDQIFLEAAELDGQTNVLVQIVHASGKLMEAWTGLPEQLPQNFSIKNYPAGVYQILLRCGKKTLLGQVVKL